MSKYFYDLEFLEGKQDKRICGIKYGETMPTIDIISIGIVSETITNEKSGLDLVTKEPYKHTREYYAISKDFNLKEAWNRYDVQEQTPFEKYNGFSGKKVYWIRENVLKPIWIEKCKEGFSFKDSPMTPYGIEILFTYQNFKKLINKYGKTNKEIAEEVMNFVNPLRIENIQKYKEQVSKEAFTKARIDSAENNPIKLYGYYSAYDHVALCWLFGKMIDLPNGFPMYTIDLQQELDRIQYNRKTLKEYIDNSPGALTKHEKHRLVHPLNLKEHENYPKQTNEHSAIHDARWNKQLYEFLQTLNN